MHTRDKTCNVRKVVPKDLITNTASLQTYLTKKRTIILQVFIFQMAAVETCFKDLPGCSKVCVTPVWVLHANEQRLAPFNELAALCRYKVGRKSEKLPFKQIVINELVFFIKNKLETKTRCRSLLCVRQHEDEH